MPGLNVLVTGGSGYLGQFVVQRLSKRHKVAYTYHANELPNVPAGAQGFKIDLATGEGLEQVWSFLDPVQVVINTAAFSQPAACEKQPELARAVNVPNKLLDALADHTSDSDSTLFIQVSTDHVYDGSKALWKEEDVCLPINVYGQSKLAAEDAVQSRWPHHFILRSSTIYGPEPPTPVKRTLFLQFVDSALRSGTPTSFFEDEFRCPVYVEDIVDALEALTQRYLTAQQQPPARLFNMGGPQRLSRVDVAKKVASARGYSTEAILAAPSASVNRGCPNPPDISMDSSALEAATGLKFRTMEEALPLVFGAVTAS